MATPFKLTFTAATCIFIAACGASADQQQRLATKGLYAASLSLDGEHAVIGSNLHGGSLWQLSPYERLFNWNASETGDSVIQATAIAPSGRYAATANQDKLIAWNAVTGEPRGFWKTSAMVNALDMDSEGSLVLLAQKDNQAVLLDSGNGSVVYQVLHNEQVLDCDISSDGQVAATGGEDNLIRVWELQSGKTIMQIPQDGSIWKLALDYKGERVFASGTYSEANIIQTATGKLLHSLPAVTGHYSAARFSKDGEYLLTGTTDGNIHLWSLSPFEKIKHWQPGSSTWFERRARIIDVSFRHESWQAIDASGIHYQLK